MELEGLIKRCLKLSLVSFLAGTAMLIWFFFSNSFQLALMSLPVILVFAMANVLLLIKLWLQWSSDKSNRLKIIKISLLMCLNIPVAIGYAFFVMVLLDSVIIRFKNATDQAMTNILLSGCDERRIDDLQPGQTKLEWIGINRTCYEHSIVINYSLKGVVKRKVVYGYVVEGKRINCVITNATTN